MLYRCISIRIYLHVYIQLYIHIIICICIYIYITCNIMLSYKHRLSTYGKSKKNLFQLCGTWCKILRNHGITGQKLCVSWPRPRIPRRLASFQSIRTKVLSHDLYMTQYEIIHPNYTPLKIIDLQQWYNTTGIQHNKHNRIQTRD